MKDPKLLDPTWGPLTDAEALNKLKSELLPLCGTPVTYLRLPADAGSQIEPGQIGSSVGVLTDMMLPRIALEKGIGLSKSVGSLGDLEGYPDFAHKEGYRIELKGVFRDNPNVLLKKAATPREPSARLTQKVTEKNVDPVRDALLVLVYQLEALPGDPTFLSPMIVDLGLFPVIECIKARDMRMTQAGGRWFGNFETPAILSNAGREKRKAGLPLVEDRYGRKESEGLDFNEDTNFGKLKRIPYLPLQEFLRSNGC